MTDRIKIHELQNVVDKAALAVLNQKLPGHGPIIYGFIAQKALPAAEANAIAKEIQHATGLQGAPTVIETPVAAGAAHEHKVAGLHPPIIIGLVLNPKV